ncbi:IS30 family transposase [Rhodopseudomonas sp. P2A-2r]|nr:IS30 family transposase [Rhodopseudomonas sp. P2A-2r]UZE52377.1 IS30 family transposase [Rhodopseudomonas sp. P2A-2r]
MCHCLASCPRALDPADRGSSGSLAIDRISGAEAQRRQQVGYKPSYAQEQTRARRWTGARLDRNAQLREQVLEGLGLGWSPEQVCAVLARQHGTPVISPESIYRFIHAQIARTKDYSWRHYLPRGKSKRGLRGRKGGSSALHIECRVPIEQRPKQVENRAIAGHWEADLMMFSRYGQAILVLHERSSRLLMAASLQGKAASPVAEIIAGLLAPLPPDLRRSITFDNGTEFARHYELHALNLQTYFCDAYAPWQKGGVENAIGRMRRRIPRKTDLAALTPSDLARCVLAYNSTPRKCLDWQTPAHVFGSQLLHFKCESSSPHARG